MPRAASNLNWVGLAIYQWNGLFIDWIEYCSTSTELLQELIHLHIKLILNSIVNSVVHKEKEEDLMKEDDDVIFFFSSFQWCLVTDHWIWIWWVDLINWFCVHFCVIALIDVINSIWIGLTLYYWWNVNWSIQYPIVYSSYLCHHRFIFIQDVYWLHYRVIDGSIHSLDLLIYYQMISLLNYRWSCPSNYAWMQV